MQTPAEYLEKTRSAVHLLFNGIDGYLSVLADVRGVSLVHSAATGAERDAELAAWVNANAARLERARKAERDFAAESFALSTLCGAVLQVAGKALEMYLPSRSVPAEWEGVVNSKTAKYCVGRSVNTVPLAMVIYAARNQHTHFNAVELREPNITAIRRIATGHGISRGGEPIVDPAFDLDNDRVLSLAANVIHLIGWHSYDNYQDDMRKLLVEPEVGT